MSETSAKIIKDSVNYAGDRLTTFEVCFHRFVLSEFNTHRALSKNSASSRAIPVHKQIERLLRSPAYPVAWPAEQKGMQGGDALEHESQVVAKRRWHTAMHDILGTVQNLQDVGLHKSVTNRLLEPFMWHTVVVTGTAWENFFAQRCSPLAQPEIRSVADLMQDAYRSSTPDMLHEGEWHLPYVSDDPEACEWASRNSGPGVGVSTRVTDPDSYHTLLAKISAARCARVSYLTQDGRRDPQADLALYDRLVEANPPHWSPLEHVATPDPSNKTSEPYAFFSKRLNRWETYPTNHLPVVGNLLGWRSLRVEVEAEQGLRTFV